MACFLWLTHFSYHSIVKDDFRSPIWTTISCGTHCLIVTLSMSYIIDHCYVLKAFDYITGRCLKTLFSPHTCPHSESTHLSPVVRQCDKSENINQIMSAVSLPQIIGVFIVNPAITWLPWLTYCSDWIESGFVWPWIKFRSSMSLTRLPGLPQFPHHLIVWSHCALWADPAMEISLQDFLWCWCS